jgi:hypothetical protein
MAIVVLVLWMFTAGAGIYLLVTSNLGRARPAANPAQDALAPQMASAVAPSVSAAAVPPATAASAPTPSRADPSDDSAASAAAAGPDQTARAARREARRATRDRWDPPSLAASKSAPMMPQFRSLVEFVHPACGIIGLAFWLGFTLVHSRPLAWIAFGLIAVTACVGVAWFTANARAARRRDSGEPPPSFSGRLIALHGAAAAVTLTLAALTALIARG